MAALSKFRERHGHEARFDVFLRQAKPLSRLPSLREIPSLDDLAQQYRGPPCDALGGERWFNRHPRSELQTVVMLDEADINLPATRQPASKGPVEDLLARAIASACLWHELDPDSSGVEMWHKLVVQGAGLPS
jgi:hypothetical protein